MSKAHYEFDEIFEWLLKYGNRKELTRYRNDIIDELMARGEIGKNLGTERQEVGLLAKVDKFLNFFRLKGQTVTPEKPAKVSRVKTALSEESTKNLKAKKQIIDEKLGL